MRQYTSRDAAIAQRCGHPKLPAQRRSRRKSIVHSQIGGLFHVKRNRLRVQPTSFEKSAVPIRYTPSASNVIISLS